MTNKAEKILQQEKEIQFTHFNEHTAWQIGTWIRDYAYKNNLPIAIDIHHGQQQLFHAVLAGANQNNAKWIKRKMNLVNLTGHSSFYWNQLLASEKKTVEQKFLLPEKDYAAHGGCVPIFIKNSGMIGTITVSGLPQEEDHNLVIQAILANLNQ